MQSIYILIPHNIRTGGPEALHQLSHAWRQSGQQRVFVVYYTNDDIQRLAGEVGKLSPNQLKRVSFPDRSNTIAEYDAYDHQPANSFENGPDTLVVLPEPLVTLTHRFAGSAVLVWWLSVDNAFGALSQTNLNRLRHPRVFHAHQSAYARDFIGALQLTSAGPLTDYTPSSFHPVSSPAKDPARVAVNANHKVIAHLDSIETKLRARLPELEWTRIVGMSREAVRETLGRAKVYLDLGMFPGMDRMPREAALLDCVVLLANAGAGATDDDFHLPSEARLPWWDEDCIADAVANAVNSYEARKAAQHPWQGHIRAEEARFTAEAAAVLKSISEQLAHLAHLPAQAGTPIGPDSRQAYRIFLARHLLASHEARAFDEHLGRLGRIPSFDVLIVDAGDDKRLAASISNASRWLYDAFSITILSHRPVPAALIGNPRIRWQQADGADEVPGWRDISSIYQASEADWLLLLEAGDQLAPHALLYFAEHALRHPAATALYADEGGIDEGGQMANPVFKPDFCPDHLLALNYPGDAVVIARRALGQIGGLRGDDGNPIYGALLRLFAAGGSSAISHVADLLLHRHSRRCLNRRQLGDTPEPALAEAAPGARVSQGWLPGAAHIEWPLTMTPKVLLVVEASADAGINRHFIENVWPSCAPLTTEIILFAASDLPSDTLGYLGELDQAPPPGLAIFAHPSGLGWGGRIAAALAASDAELVLIVRPDIAPAEPGWLELLAGHACRNEIGAVAPRLIDRQGKLIGNALLLGMQGFAIGLGHGEPYNSPGPQGRLLVPQNPSALSADAILLSRAAIDEAVGMEHHLGPTATIIDLCLRIGQAGRRLLWTPHVSLACLDSQHDRLAPDEELALMERWLPKLARDPGYNVNMSREAPFTLTEVPQVSRLRLPWKPTPRLIAFPADNMGCGHYRVIEPFNAALQADLMDGFLDFAHYNPFDMAVFEADTLFLQRQIGDEQIEHLRAYRRFFDFKLVYEMDDLITNVPVTSLHKGNIPKDIAARVRKGLELCDRFIVTTEPLKEAYGKLIDDVRIIPNYLDKSKWAHLQPRRRTGKKPRVGWAGGVSHTGDLALLIDLVKATADEVDWVFMGFCLEEIKPYTKELRNGVLTPQYPAQLATLDLDLAIAPIAENGFNDCKSNLKLLEYGILGFPVIATDFGPYRRSKDMPGITLVKNRHKDWLSALRSHINDLDECARRGDALRQHMLANWMLQDHMEEWRSAWFDF